MYLVHAGCWHWLSVPGARGVLALAKGARWRFLALAPPDFTYRTSPGTDGGSESIAACEGLDGKLLNDSKESETRKTTNWSTEIHSQTRPQEKYRNNVQVFLSLAARSEGL